MVVLGSWGVRADVWPRCAYFRSYTEEPFFASGWSHFLRVNMDSIILSDWLQQRFDAAAAEPAYRQLFRLVQQAILSGRLAAGTKLPSSRSLGADLGIARNTVIQVYEQL